MTVRTYKLTGVLPIVGTDGVTRRGGNVELDDEVTNIDALAQLGAIEAPAPEPKAKPPTKE